ncbi:MAG TPA: hypothetical protein VHE14_07450 [Solirubrobacteraceae bacterium]|nr:hypothetical protein [Solirubrobacteraceae bacterium]
MARLVARMGGARLCYGKPIQVGKQTIVPVATLRAIGGGGFGISVPDEPQALERHEAGRGGGGGGYLEGRPVGFIEVGPDGARFQRIALRTGPVQRLIWSAAAGASVVGAAAVGGAAGGALLQRLRSRRLLAGRLRAGRGRRAQSRSPARLLRR